MTWYNSLLEKLYGLAGETTPYTAWAVLGEIKKAGSLSVDELEARQWQRLSGLIGYAYENIKLYRDLWGGAGIHPRDIKDKADFAGLPVLTRSALEARPAADLLSSGADTRGLVMVCSSGTTTGTPLQIFLDTAGYNHQYANLLYGYYLTGWRLGTPMITVRNFAHGDYRGVYSCGTFSPEPFGAVRSLVYRLVHRKRLLAPMQGGMAPREEHLSHICRRIRAYSPYLLEGNGYFWYQFARYLLERGESLPSVKAVEIDEVCLSPEQKSTIARSLGCPVYDCYGSHELGVVAHGCRAGQGNHVLSLSHYVEIINDESGRQAAPDEIGSVIITDMANRTTPLIRYETGDLAEKLDRPCPCGSAYPLISSLAGRKMNSVKAAGATFTEKFFLELIFRFEGVVAFQVDKSDPRQLKVELIARAPGAEGRIEQELRQATGMPVSVRRVADIALERPGKARWVRA